MYNQSMKNALVFVVVALSAAALANSAFTQLQPGSYENSFVLTPLYVEYQDVSDQEFANQVQELRVQLPAAPYVKVGFATFMTLQFPDVPLDQPLKDSDLASDLGHIDKVVERARVNGTIVHMGLISSFLHGQDALRYSAIRQDVRNAQWFADGWIAEPSQLKDPSNLPLSV